MRIASFLLLLALAGCGFHLEGSTPLPASLAVVHVDTTNSQTDFYFGLRKALMAAGTRVEDDSHDDSSAVIHILNDSSLQRTLTVSTLNGPTEYELTYKVRFSVTVKGRELIAPEEHSLVRDYSYSENAQLAKERENAILSQALAHDLVSVVMRRLASLSGSPTHS
jgi:LPS-assembly lipoprotein